MWIVAFITETTCSLVLYICYNWNSAGLFIQCNGHGSSVIIFQGSRPHYASVFYEKIIFFNNPMIANYFNVHGKSQAELYNTLQQHHLYMTRFQEENHIRTIQLQSTWMLAFHIYVTVFNPCKSNPCRNKGICTNRRNSFTCMCVGNFYGITCDGK